MSTLGERIRETRTKRGLSQRGLDAAAGICRGQTQLLEKGNRQNPSSKVLGGLARALGVRMDWLLTGNGSAELDSPPPAADSGASVVAEAAPETEPEQTNKPNGNAA